MCGSSTRPLSSRTAAAAVAAVLTVTFLAGCTEEPRATASVSDAPTVGGTVRVLTDQTGFSSLDPQRIFIATEMNVSRLITRSLTTYQTADSPQAGELVGDLATDTGTANDDFTQWTFTLRDGIKWETGEDVTCEDVRYGVLRNFDIRNKDAVITDGPPYPVMMLDVPQSYKGPRTDGDLVDGGVTCIDARTIQFDLVESTSMFAAVVAMPAFAPVLAASDTWADYGTNPLSTGPYKLTSYEPAPDEGQGKAVFERNEHWDADTDDVRQAKPDTIEFVFGVEREYAAQQIIADNPEYANSVMYQNVPANYVQQVVNDQELMAQTVTGASNSIRYMAINTSTVTDVECRKALVIGFNKRKFQDVYGGSIFGDYATTMISPADPGHRDFDVYGLKDKPEGDLEQAKRIIEDAGDCPRELTLDAVDSPTGTKIAQTVVDTYGRIGIKVHLNLIPATDFFSEINSIDGQHDLVIAGWVADWPGGSGVIPALFDGDLIVDGANNNYSLLDDPEINNAIDAARAAGEEAGDAWGELDEDIQRLAAVVPISYTKALSLCGKNVRGAYLDFQWSAVDVVSLGVAGA